jgi:putative Mg2+ transporter-C (MgtC) family protein
VTSLYLDEALRLSLATVIGALIGLNRDLHGKPAGLRTHGLVALGSALILLVSGNLPGAVDFHAADAQSRAIQGLVTGIGFLGAGVILHEPSRGRIQGLTTAAAIWVSALFGAGCGAGLYAPVLIAFVLLTLILVFGGQIERRVHRWLRPGEMPSSPPQDS